MSNIEQTIKNFLITYNIDNPEEVYLVAFSGGFDSMCLLHALNRAVDNRIIALHLNHNWRGKESLIEEINCKNFCDKLGIEFYCEKLPDDIPHTETEAREARYSFFERASKNFESNIVFTAHNKNDNAETLIYRFAKGTGITGLCGISPHRDIYYRPLLRIDRKTIEAYCKSFKLSPNNDSSNTNIVYKRNFIRGKIIPALEQINPYVINTVNSLCISANESEQILNEYMKIIYIKIFKDNKFLMSEFLKLSKPVQMRIIYNLITPLVPKEYDRQRIQIVLDFINNNKDSKSGKVCSVTTGYNLYVCNKYFELIKETKQEQFSIKIDKTGEYRNGRIIVNICEFDGNYSKGDKLSGRTVYVDFSSLDFDFEFRNRRDGDIIQPYGMSGHQKLKKYLNAKKIPNHKKDNLLFLAQGNEILWAVDIGISEKIRVKTNPTHVIEVGINGN